MVVCTDSRPVTDDHESGRNDHGDGHDGEDCHVMMITLTMRIMRMVMTMMMMMVKTGDNDNDGEDMR